MIAKGEQTSGIRSRATTECTRKTTAMTNAQRRDPAQKARAAPITSFRSRLRETAGDAEIERGEPGADTNEHRLPWFWTWGQVAETQSQRGTPGMMSHASLSSFEP